MPSSGTSATPKPWELEWWSVYSANTLCLDDYRHGRVFFVGDAAHIVPIFGVRGLNNGLADAHNLGWKLGLVLNGEAEDRLLDSYSPERRGATLDVFANATKSTRFMTPPTRGWRLAREAALSLSLKHEFPRSLANPRQMQPYTYAESPLSPYARIAMPSFAAGPISGSASPNAKLADGTHLLDHAGDGMTAILFCDGRANAEQAALLGASSVNATNAWSTLLIQWQRFFDPKPGNSGFERRNRLPVRRAARHVLSSASRPARRRAAGKLSFPTKSSEPPTFASADRCP